MANKNKILHIFGFLVVLIGLFFAFQEKTEAQSGSNSIANCLKIKSIDGSEKNVFECINANLEALKTNDISLTQITGKDNKAKTENYQRQRKLDVDGSIGVQTGFDLGFAIGALSRTNNNCTDINISYNNATRDSRFFKPTPSTYEDDQTENAKLIIDILKCLTLVNQETKDFKSALNTVTDTDLEEWIKTDNKTNKQYVSRNFMFELGKRFGQLGGQVNAIKNTTTPTPGSSGQNNCDEYTELTKKIEGVDADNIAKATIECLNTNQARLQGNQFDLRIITGADAKAMIKDYQKARNLKTDSIVGIQTGFDIGFGIGRISPLGDTCEDITVSYNLSSREPKFHPQTAIRENDTKNKEFLMKVLDCLKLIPEGTDSLSAAFGSGAGNISDPLNILRGNGMIIPSTDGKNQVEKTFMYNLGRRFGSYGGKIELIPEAEEDEDETNPEPEDPSPPTPVEPIDYCSNKNINDLSEGIYSSNSINIIPRNPGVIEWRDVKEVNSEECLTGTQLTASLIGRLIRFFELFVAVIAVIVFVYGGFLFMTAQGEEGQHEKSIHVILYGVGGIFLIIMSRIITEIFVPIGNDGLRVDRSKAFTTDIKATSQIFDFTNWALSFASLIAVCMIIYGGYLYMTAAGDDGQQESGKKTIIASVIGLFIIFSAYTIVAVLLGGIGLEVK